MSSTFNLHRKYILGGESNGPPVVKVARLLGGQTIIGYAAETPDGVCLSSPREVVAVPENGTARIVFLPINSLGPLEYAGCPALLLLRSQYYSLVEPRDVPDLVTEYNNLIFSNERQ